MTITSNTKSRKNITRKFVTWTDSIGAVINFSVSIKLTKGFKLTVKFVHKCKDKIGLPATCKVIIITSTGLKI